MTAARPGGPPRGPKPFAYVPLYDGPVERAARLVQGHERYLADRRSGRIEGVIVALSPVHVGAGTVERTARVAPAFAAQAPLVSPHLRLGGTPVLPGSTLKGAVRAVAEAITPSCLGVRGRLTVLPAALAELETCPRRARARDEQYCAACRVFGALGYEGRVRFADALLTAGETIVQQAPALPPARLQRGGGPLPGRKFYQHGQPATGIVPLEACAPAARFALRVDFLNLAPAELGVLLIALGQGEPSWPLKLGGYKPACLGSVRIELTALALDDGRRRALAYEPAVEADRDALDLAPYLAAAASSGLLLGDRLERLAEILRYPGEGECAAGLP